MPGAIGAMDDECRHLAIAQFEARWISEFLLVTQNIDDLHQRAGSQRILPMHGELLKARCVETGRLYDWRDDLSVTTPHPEDPSKLGRLRPHVVWFGELPLGLDRIREAAEQADWFIAIGTSAQVYPAASIVDWTPASCRRVEINLENTPASPRFEQSLRGRAGDIVPEFLQTL